MERYEEALVENQKAVELEPDNAEIIFNLGRTLHSLRRFKEADIKMKDVIAIESSYLEKAKELGYIEEPG